MKTILGLAPWLNRLVLVAASFIFTAISLRYLNDPVHASAAVGVTLNSPLALSTTRIGLGGFPLGIAIFSLVCLLSSRRLLAGVTLVTTVITTAIGVRLFSALSDGWVPESTRLFIPEAVILLLSLTGLILETARRRQTF